MHVVSDESGSDDSDSDDLFPDLGVCSSDDDDDDDELASLATLGLLGGWLHLARGRCSSGQPAAGHSLTFVWCCVCSGTQATERDAPVSTAHVQRTVAAALRVTLPSVPQGQGITLRKPSEFDWEEHVRDMRPHNFKLRYRLTAEVFYDLLDLLRPDLQNDNQKQEANNSGKGFVVRPVVKLAIALRYLAGGDPLDLKLIYHVSKAYIMDCVWRVVDAVNTRLRCHHCPWSIFRTSCMCACCKPVEALLTSRASKNEH